MEIHQKYDLLAQVAIRPAVSITTYPNRSVSPAGRDRIAQRQQASTTEPPKQAYVPPSLRGRQQNSAPARVSLNETTTMKKITPASSQQQQEEKKRAAAAAPPPQLTPQQEGKALRNQLQQVRRQLREVSEAKLAGPTTPELRLRETTLRDEEARVLAGLNRLGLRP